MINVLALGPVGARWVASRRVVSIPRGQHRRSWSRGSVAQRALAVTLAGSGCDPLPRSAGKAMPISDAAASELVQLLGSGTADEFIPALVLQGLQAMIEAETVEPCSARCPALRWATAKAVQPVAQAVEQQEEWLFDGRWVFPPNPLTS
jgi:hypothetical protein